MTKDDLVQATSAEDLAPNGQLHSEEYELNFGNTGWRSASRAAFIVAERRAGFRPKMSSDDPRYMDTLATSGFSGNNIDGRIKYVPIEE